MVLESKKSVPLYLSLRKGLTHRLCLLGIEKMQNTFMTPADIHWFRNVNDSRAPAVTRSTRCGAR
jgi:hypothetical protein